MRVVCIGHLLSRYIILTMPKKILFLTLNTFSFTGGIQKVCRVFTRTLYDLSVQDLITPRAFSMYDKTKDRDAKYILKSQFKGYNGNQIAFALASINQGIRSDTVILSHINLLFIALIIRRLSPKTKIILFVHGIEVWRNIKTWKGNFLRKHCEIWAVSNYTASQMHDRHGVPMEKIKVIHNCLDPFLEIPSEFSKPEELLRRYNLSTSAPVLFTLTRLSSSELYKGYDLVIETIRELIDSFPEIKYLIAGKADPEEQNRLINLIEHNHLQEHVLLLGFVPEEELSEHFLLSDVFVMPSRKEGFGIVFIEAAACGCKTIAGNQDGSVDALMGGKLGTLVSPIDKQAIYEAILRNLQKDRTVESSKKIQTLCMENFSYKSYYSKIKQLICE
jgi:phosphatidyl-myo-inositol dimannoside synthase